MTPTLAELDAFAAAEQFSGAISLSRGDELIVEKVYGYADRRFGIENRIDTIFALASGAKTMTATAVMALVEDGTVSLDTRAREILGDDLPLIADDVTIDHLLTHRSGIGDYLNEDELSSITDYVLTIPSHRLVTAEDYLPLIDGFPTVFPAGERFFYNNGGYVVLALLAERASGVDYHQLLTDRVFVPAGLTDTAFLRSDELPPRAAVGYLEADGLRTNVVHMPLRGLGDGGVYSTVADIKAYWAALMAGRIIPAARVAQMTEPQSHGTPEDDRRYGRGLWVHPSTREVHLEGYDAGISFRGAHDPDTGYTRIVVSNSSDGAWGMDRLLRGEA